MKFSNLTKSEDGNVVKVDLEMSDQENQFFLSVAFNHLLSNGLISLNEQTGQVEAVVNESEKAKIENPSH